MKFLLVVNSTPSNMLEYQREESAIGESLEELGHEVVWKTTADLKILTELTDKFDYIIIAKNYSIRCDDLIRLKQKFQCKILYWMSDYIGNFEEVEGWVKELAIHCDVWLGVQMQPDPWFNENRVVYHNWNLLAALKSFKVIDDIRVTQHFPQCAYPDILPVGILTNWTHNNYRTKFLRELQNRLPGMVHVTAATYNEFLEGKHSDTGGLDPSELHMGLYGEDFSKLVHITKINLSLPWEPKPSCVSANIVRYMVSGGFVLAQYLEGMELTFKDKIVYFKDMDDCEKKIKYYLEHEDERKQIAEAGRLFAEEYLRPLQRVKELLIYLENI